VLTDLMMPVMDGNAMMQVLVKMDPKVKVIAASGLGANRQPPALLGHFQHFLAKPYTAEKLLGTLATVIRGGEAIERSCGRN